MTEWQWAEEQLSDILQKRNYPRSVEETAIGTIADSKNKQETAVKVRKILETITEAKAVVKALQPIIRENIREE